MISRLSREQLKKIAFYQKMVILSIIVSLLALFYPTSQIFFGLVQVFFVYKLAKANDVLTPWLYAIMCFMPGLCLIAFYKTSTGATELLRENGIKVGLWGAKKF